MLKNRMGRKSTAIICLGLLVACLSPWSRACEFHHPRFHAGFLAILEAAENQPVERRTELWQWLYVRKHQVVFNDLAST